MVNPSRDLLDDLIEFLERYDNELADNSKKVFRHILNDMSIN